MIVTAIENTDSIREQKINEVGFGKNIFDEIKKLISQDIYGLFEIKNSVALDQKIKETNSSIESLVKTNTTVKKQIEDYQKRTEQLQLKNSQIIEKMKLVIK